MNPDVKNLYKQTLLAHSKQPHNRCELTEAAHATLRNPLCGDEITVYRKTNRNGTTQATFTAQACTICLASASLMTQHLKELPPEQATQYTKSFVSKFKETPEEIPLEGDLAALTGVHAFPSRIRCATLPWEAFLKIQS